MQHVPFGYKKKDQGMDPPSPFLDSVKFHWETSEMSLSAGGNGTFKARMR